MFKISLHKSENKRLSSPESPLQQHIVFHQQSLSGNVFLGAVETVLKLYPIGEVKVYLSHHSQQ